MHLQINPELQQAISIMKFLKYTDKPEYLLRRGSNFMIALMKLSSAVFCEIILIIMMTHVDNIEDIIKDFVALEFIVQVDNWTANNLRSYDT